MRLTGRTALVTGGRVGSAVGSPNVSTTSATA